MNRPKSAPISRPGSVRGSVPNLTATPSVGVLDVISIDRVQVADLTRADARGERIGSLPELLDGLGAVYPEVASVIRVRFGLV